jgi:hypothetical protein
MTQILIPVKDHQSLARDSKTGAIVNINSNEIEQAREVKAARKQKDNEVENLKEDVASLKNDLSDIKRLLLQLVEKQ